MVEPPAMLDVGLCAAAIPDTAVPKDIVKVTFVAEGNDVRTVVAKETMSAAREIDESASDVVVYGLVRGRLPVQNCGEQCSLVSLGQPTLKAGYMEKKPTDNVQGVVRYGKLAGEIDEPAPDVVVYGMVSRCSPSPW